jgi:hypothetical protein
MTFPSTVLSRWALSADSTSRSRLLFELRCVNGLVVFRPLFSFCYSVPRGMRFRSGKGSGGGLRVEFGSEDGPLFACRRK